ncbi:hypothetical protein GE09DRAFT_1187049 [Coniochaeta sp. 2T2.1]|nr:hypothetical protein GE09DRAFT_1187049 [Coniochaeta sp. 2T2.1]
MMPKNFKPAYASSNWRASAGPKPFAAPSPSRTSVSWRSPPTSVPGNVPVATARQSKKAPSFDSLGQATTGHAKGVTSAPLPDPATAAQSKAAPSSTPNGAVPARSVSKKDKGLDEARAVTQPSKPEPLCRAQIELQLKIAKANLQVEEAMFKHWDGEVHKYHSDENMVYDNTYDYNYVVGNLKSTQDEIGKLQAKLSVLEWKLKQVLV